MFKLSDNIHSIDRVWRSNPFMPPSSEDIASPVPEDSIRKRAGSIIPDSISRSKTQHANMQLQGIWYSGKVYKAMISDTIVTAGSDLNGYLIQRIEDSRVLLRSIQSGDIIVLELNE